MTNPKRTYRHKPFYRFLTNKPGYVTAAIEPSEDNEHLRIAFSFCSPQEKNFNKAKGRTIANGRLDKGLYVEVLYKWEQEGKPGKGLEITELVWGSALKDYFLTLNSLGRPHLFPQWLTESLHEEEEIKEYAKDLDLYGDDYTDEGCCSCGCDECYQKF